MITIALPGYAGFAVLRSAAGQVVGGRLQGAFHIAFLGQVTGDVVFNGAADGRVQISGGPATWEVAQAQPVMFAFAGELGAATSAPRICGAELYLARKAGTPRCALGFGLASLSLIAGTAPDAASASISSPSASAVGVTQTPVEPVRDPVSGMVSFLILPGPQGFEVRFGARGNQFNISHVSAAVVQIGDQVEMGHVIADPGGVAASRTNLTGGPSSAAPAKRVTLALMPAQGLRMMTADEAVAVPRSLSIEGDMVRIGAFHGDRLTAAIIDAAPARLAALHGRPDQFRFALKLPKVAGQPPPGEAAQLTFTDARVVKDLDYADLSERFDGLSVAGLASVRSDAERLDCSHATVTLGAGGFALRAGLPLTYLDGTSEPAPKLIPKRRKGGARRLEMALGSMRLVCDQGFAIDTADKAFSAFGTGLEGRPNGPAGAAAPGGRGREAYASFVLERPGALMFDLTAGGLHPREPRWLEEFDYPADQAFRLLDHPGLGYTLRRQPEVVALDGGVDVTVSERRTELTEHRTATGQDILAVSVLISTLSYLAVRHFQGEEGETFVGENELKLNLRLIENGKILEYAKGVASNDVRLVFEGGSAASVAALDQFINDNLPAPAPGNARKVMFALGSSLAVLLRAKADGKTLNLFDVAATRKKAAKTLFALDFSEVRGLGLDWKTLAGDDRFLWPNLFDGDAKAKDPSHPGWKGLFFRDVALNLNIASAALALIYKDFPNLKRLVEAFNDALILDYGWFDGAGATWSSRLAPAKPIQLSGSDLLPYLSIEIEKALFQGFAGASKRAGAKVRITLPFLAEKKGQEGPGLVGEFDFNLGEENPFGRIKLRSTKGPIATKAIPGFDEIRLAGFTTDFQTAQADLELFPSAKLKAFADAFDLPPGKPFEAAVSFDLKKGGLGSSLALVTKHEIRTKLLGKWPLIIQSMRIDLGEKLALRFTGRIELGFPNLRSVGVRVILQKDGDDWDYKILPESVDAQLGLAGIDIKAHLEWRNDDQADREFWGSLELMGGPLNLKNTKIAFRAGATAGRAFWVAGAGLPRIRVGSAAVEEPLVIVGHGAELAGLTDVIADPSKNLKVLRDGKKKPGGSDEQKPDRDWLKEWRPSASVGTVVILSGYLTFDERLAGSAKKKDEDDGKGRYLTNLVFTDNGQYRIDAWLKLMGSDELMTRLVFALDTEREIISAGVQLPRIKIPGPKKAELEVYPGFLYASVSYGRELYFKYSVGWPDRIDGPGLERDWSKSTKVHVSGAWPINTFWGGVLAEYREGGTLTLGFALRAGWTKSYPGIGVKNIAHAEADLGITLGGVLVVVLGKPTQELEGPPEPLRLPAPADDARTDTTLTQDAARAADAAYSARAAAAPFISALRDHLAAPAGLPELNFTAEIYGDIWGRGSAVFLGVTLASIKVAAYSRFAVKGSTEDGITSMRSITGYEVSVTILCVHYSAWVEVEVVVVRR